MKYISLVKLTLEGKCVIIPEILLYVGCIMDTMCVSGRVSGLSTSNVGLSYPVPTCLWVPKDMGVLL